MPVLDNPKHEAFVQGVFRGEDATKAYIGAGYSAKTAAFAASRLLSDVKVQRRLRELQAETAKVAVFERADLLEEYLRVALADPNEIVRNEVGACRYCHGIDHQYQWRTEAEFHEAVDAWRKIPERKRAFVPRPEDVGGFGFSSKREPHPDCPNCEGDGVSKVRILDTTRLSPGARALYAGIEMTKDGFKVRMHSKLAAMEKIGQILGAFQKDNEQKAGATEALIAALVERTRTSGSKIPFATAQDKDAAK